MRNPFKFLITEWRQFDGLTLFFLVTWIILMLGLPVWKLWAIVNDMTNFLSPPLWVDIPLRVLLAGTLAFYGASRMRRRSGFPTARLKVVAWVFFLAVVVIAVLQFSEIINIIPG